MTQAAIEALLRQKIGLDAASVGSTTLTRAIHRRMEDCGLTDLGAYLKRLQTSVLELEELIETVVVPETWFFRDREPFKLLTHYVLSEWRRAHPNEVLRILSVPCATGEEPYSIAIALLDVGFSTTKFCIDAVDISKKALLKAQKAIYGRNSFRGGDLDFRERYFTRLSEETYQLNPSIQTTVNFLNHNLLDLNFLTQRSPYDIIFCRNVLIYFDPDARKQTVQCLERLLTDEGLLFVGHSETGQILSPHFVSVRHSLAFAYRKAEAFKKTQVGIETQTRSLSLDREKKSLIPPATIAKVNEAPFKVPKDQTNQLSSQDLLSSSIPQKQVSSSLPPIPKEDPVAKETPSNLPDLNIARRLANEGKLDEAATLCHTYLNQNKTNPEAYFLLGQVHQAAGNLDKAEECFHKAIYLEPDRQEALLHLSLLKENRGDIAGATRLKLRLQRLQTLPRG